MMRTPKGKSQQFRSGSKSNSRFVPRYTSSNSNSNTFKSSSKVIMFTPLDPKSYGAQASYTTVLDTIINDIKVTFDNGGKDVQECLETLEIDKRLTFRSNSAMQLV